MRAMEIQLKTAGVAANVSALRRLAGAYRDLATAEQSVRFRSPTATVEKRFKAAAAAAGEYLKALREIGHSGGVAVPSVGRAAGVSVNGNGAGNGAARDRIFSDAQLQRLAKRRDPGPSQSIFSAAERRRLEQEPGGSDARVRTAKARLTAAERGGDPSRLFDAQVALRRAERSREQDRRLLEGPNLSDRLRELVRSTRFNAGGASPLVGRAYDVAEMLTPALGAKAAPVAIAVAGLMAVGMAAKAAAADLRDSRQAASLSGGSSGDIARLRAGGVAPGEIGGLANSLRDRLASDPLSAIFGAQMGIRPQLPVELGGSQNNARLLADAMEGLRVTRRLYGAEEQLRRARILGLDSVLDLVNVSPSVAAAQRRAGLFGARINDERSQQLSRDLDARRELLRQSERNAGTAFGKAFLPAQELWLDLRTGLNNILAGAMSGGAASRFSQPDAMQENARNPPLSPAEKHRRAVEANTTALEALAGMIKSPIGGGARSNAPIVFNQGTDPRAGLTSEALRMGGLGAFEM